ncbi:hypothetical protein BGX26_006138, partial [Mortierella sp. AD094]
PQRCLPSRTDTSLIQEVSEVPMAGTVLPVQNPPIRSVTSLNTHVELKFLTITNSATG